MISVLRGSIGKYLILGVISLIALVFALEGFFFNRATRGGGGFGSSSTAGTVNGEAIALADFYKALSRTREQYRRYFGDKVTDEQLKMFGIEENTFRMMARGKVIAQDAKKKKIPFSVTELKDNILEIPAFQKEGRFDPILYKDLLAANGMNAGSFEADLKRDLIAREWGNHYAQFIPISNQEVESAFFTSKNLRKVKFIRIPKSKVEASKKNFGAWLASLKSTAPKAQEELDKTLKDMSLKAETTGLISKDQAASFGLASQEVMAKLFSNDFKAISAKDPALTETIETPTETLLIAVLEAKTPPKDAKEIEKGIAAFRPEYTDQKRREIVENITSNLVKKAKIEMNASIQTAGAAG